jgi:hypothetical protein
LQGDEHVPDDFAAQLRGLRESAVEDLRRQARLSFMLPGLPTSTGDPAVDGITGKCLDELVAVYRQAEDAVVRAVQAGGPDFQARIDQIGSDTSQAVRANIDAAFAEYTNLGDSDPSRQAAILQVAQGYINICDAAWREFYSALTEVVREVDALDPQILGDPARRVGQIFAPLFGTLPMESWSTELERERINRRRD